jgi:hypothetical protein
MKLSIRTVRNLVFGALLAVTFIAADRDAFATSCADAWGGGGSMVTLQYCGPYSSTGEAFAHMESVALGFCWSPGAYLYWYARVGDFSGPEYYDSAWACWW